MRNDPERVRDILEAIEQIERYAAQGERHFRDDELVQTWIVHQLQIVGEAASKISASRREAHPNIPWAQIGAMRNVLIHEYFGVDLDEVWATVETDLPKLKDNLLALLRAIGQEEKS